MFDSWILLKKESHRCWEGSSLQVLGTLHDRQLHYVRAVTLLSCTIKPDCKDSDVGLSVAAICAKGFPYLRSTLVALIAGAPLVRLGIPY